jgi:hypothetical protein
VLVRLNRTSWDLPPGTGGSRGIWDFGLLTIAGSRAEIPSAAPNWEAAYRSLSTALNISLVLLEGTWDCGCAIFWILNSNSMSSSKIGDIGIGARRTNFMPVFFSLANIC